MRHVLLAILAVVTIGSPSVSAQDCAGPFPSDCPLLATAKVIFVGSVTENEKNSPSVKFHVIEAFKGIHSDVVDLDKGLHEFGFEVGKQYLVFAVPCIWQGADKHCLMNGICSSTRSVENAAAILQQLRAEKNGNPVAAVYGTLVRTLGAGRHDWKEGYDHPLPNIVVRLRSDKNSFETITDPQGAYAFGRVPPGKYQVSADLPPDLELGNVIGDGPVEPFELPRRCCFENNLYALPSGRITGQVIGPDGKPLRLVIVYLYPASRYKNGERGVYGLQGRGIPSAEWKPFEFHHLPADDYVLVMNPRNERNSDASLPMTFYPRSATIEGAQIIHLADGQKLSDADIHVDSPLPARQVTVRLLWGDKQPKDFYPPQLIVKASTETPPFAEEAGPDVYKVNVLLGARYTVHAEAYCRVGTKNVRTDDATVDGSDQSVSEIEIRFANGECAHE